MSHSNRRLRAAAAVGLVLSLSLGSAIAPGVAADASGDTASISGVLIMPDGLAIPTAGQQLRVTKVASVNGVPTGIVGTTVAADGSFVLSGLAADEEHHILFSQLSGSSVLRMYYGGAFTFEASVPLVLAPGENRDLGSIQLHRPGSISGSLSNEDGTDFTPAITIVSGPSPLVGTGPTYNRFAQTYVIGGLYPGNYVVRFAECCQGLTWKSVYNGEYLTAEAAVPISVGLSENVTVDATLPPARSISGVFSVDRDPSVTTPILSTISLRPFPGLEAGTPQRGTQVFAEGEFVLSGIEPGAYQICARDEGSRQYQAIFTQCFGQDDANPDGVPVIMGTESRGGIDLTVQGATRITVSGLGRADPADAGARIPITHSYAFFWRFDEQQGFWVREAQASSIGGGFGILSSPPMREGDYRVQLQYLVDGELYEPTRQYREYWPGGVTRFTEAEIISPVRGELVDLGPTDVSPTPLDITRLSGPNRFAGSAAISRELIPTPPVNVVYIANGLNYPDALSAGPAVSAEGGTLLLVQPNLIPAEIETELRRLQPDRIVIVGSTRTVSAAVETQLQAFVDSPSDIERRSGTDRYDTARRVVREAFEGSTGMTVVIATGSNYPDALAAGPVAAALGGPVLLVNGNRPSLDAATVALLDELQPEAFLIAGGTNTVSAGIEAQLLSRTSEVYRAAGRDRYETGRILNSIFVPQYGFRYNELGGTDLVYVATGTGFADALAGGPLAARDGAPLYLTPPRCLGAGIVDAVEDLGAREIVILGGPPAVSTAVEAGVECAVSATRGEATELQRALGELLAAREP